jgi:blue copper oxidase
MKRRTFIKGGLFSLAIAGADAAGLSPYMYHCHLLEHEDNGMMGQFEVIK